ncbi:MAG TPA: hypothetical protein VFJ47_15080 [Terriglobales bacterium]|nr:hypothetical protein [Terriglobales bacterium]
MAAVEMPSWRKLSWLSFALGLAMMTAMFVWSFQLQHDYSGQYGTEPFHRQFWVTFFLGIFFYAAGCFLLGLTMKAQHALILGIGVILTGVVLFQLIMPRVNFEGWTGGSGYMLTIMLSSGGLLTSTVGGMRYLWRKIRTPYSQASN